MSDGYPKPIEERLREVEQQLAAISGIGSVPGWIERVEKEQKRSAGAQGRRLGDLQAASEREIALLQNENKELRAILTSTRETVIDGRARVLGAIAVVAALGSAVMSLVKALT